MGLVIRKDHGCGVDYGKSLGYKVEVGFREATAVVEGGEGGEKAEVRVDECQEGMCMVEGIAESEATMGVDRGRGVGKERVAEGRGGGGLANLCGWNYSRR